MDGCNNKNDCREQLLSGDGNTSIRDFIDITRRNDISDIDLPELAVAGDTSSGKSSLLSALTSIELPSAADICTRCPTRIIMKTTEPGSEEYIRTRIHWDMKGQGKVKPEANDLSTFKSVEKINLNERIAQLQKSILECDEIVNGVSHSVIEVELCGPDYTDFTVIDLPGIVSTLGKNDAPDTGERIDMLLQTNLKNPHCMILAIMPANVEFHNSQILKRALEFDKETTRTLPVVTKPDLVDMGCESKIANLVNGVDTKESYRLGFHMVRLRSQQDLNNGKSIQASIVDEMDWFKRSAYHHKISQDQFGIIQLRKKLANIYMTHLINTIPSVKAQLEERLKQVSCDLQNLGIDTSTADNRAHVKHEILRAVEQEVNSITTNMKYAVENPPETEDKVPLITVRASLEHEKCKFAEAIRPKKYGDIQEGEVVRIAFEGELIECSVHAVQEREKNSNDKFLLVPANTSDPHSWPNKHIEALVDLNHKSTSIPRNEKEYLINAKDGYTYAYFSHDQIINGKRYNSGFYSLRFFSEVDLMPCYDELVDEIRSNRERPLQIFEGEPMFISRIQKWLEFIVEPECIKLSKSIADIVHRQLESFVNENKLASHRTGLKNELKEALLTAQDKMKNSLVERLEQVINDEWMPQTHNDNFSCTIYKFRNNMIRNLLLSAQKMVNNEKVVSVDFIENVLTGGDHRELLRFIADDIAIALRAYFQIAHKNIVDSVAKIIDTQLVGLSPKIGSSKYGRIQSLYTFALEEIEKLDFEILLQDTHFEAKLKKLKKEHAALKNSLEKLPILRRKFAE
mmetsp:Transcript_5266/g.7412  ORF Transcript_5266/g.7412 Transcript_5266/m.7412 type:complete len:800 (+) Transcript_5266:303-2702(+)